MVRVLLLLVLLVPAGCRSVDSGKGDRPPGMTDGDADADSDADADVDTGDSGDTDTDPVDTAPYVSTRDDYVEIGSYGDSYVCAIREDRTADCWGRYDSPWPPSHIDDTIVDMDFEAQEVEWSNTRGELWR